MRCRPFVTVLLGAVVLMARPAQAQCAANATTSSNVTSASLTVCMHVRDVLLLTMGANSTGLSNPALANYGPLATYVTAATPLAAATTPAISVTANRAYEVSIAAPLATFGPSGVNKPIGDIQWRLGAGAFSPLSTTAASLALPGTAGTTTSTLAFRSRWAFERDKPGAYSTTIVLTLSAR